MSLFALAALSFGLAALETPSAILEICARPTIECQIGIKGVTLGRPGTTEAYKGLIDDAAARFTQFFGAQAPQAVVVLGEITEEDIRTTLDATYPVVMPWLTSDQRKKLIRKSIRQQIKQLQPHLEGAELDRVVDMSVDVSLSQSKTLNRSESLNQGALAHELGHVYFIRTYYAADLAKAEEKAKTGPVSLEEYGGPAPDWLDEMSALLLENNALTTQRIDQLKSFVKEDNLKALWPLKDYFTMQHPAYGNVRKMIEQQRASGDLPKKGGQIIMVASKRDLTDSNQRDPLNFYIQSRAFADFMIAKTGNQQIFASIAQHVANGGTIDSWLAKNADKMGMADTVEALQTAFDTWLKEEFSS